LLTSGTLPIARIADDAITGAKIAHNTLDAIHINASAVGASELNVSGNGSSGQVLTSDGDGTFSWTNKTVNTDTNYYLDGITKSGNTLTFSVNGATNQTYTFGSNAFNSTTIPTNNNQLTNGAGYITSFDITTQTDPKYLRSDTSDTVAAGRQISFYSNDNIESAGSDQASLEVFQDTSGADAFMQFHVSGDYALYFGLDGSTNDLAVGGWSMGANKYRVYHAGNLSLSTLGYTGATNANYITNNNQLTNGAGYITGISFANVSSKPAFSVNSMLSSRATTAIDTVGDSNGVTFNYLSSSTSNKPSGTDHSLMTMSYSANWQTQLAQDWRNKGRMYLRGQNNGTWSSWVRVHSTDDFSTTDVANGVTAYGWGDHAAQGI
jgi:hypothetical protein